MRGVFVVCIAFTALVCICGPARATIVNWGTGDEGHVYDGPDDTYPILDCLVDEDIATKPLVQLIWVGTNGVIDLPDLSAPGFLGGDDELLAESSLGAGYGPPSALCNGRWSKTGSDVDANTDDLIFARAWNVTKSQISGLPTIWWHFGNSGLFKIEDARVPSTFPTGDIYMIVPEPGFLLVFAVAGLLALRRRRSKTTD